MINIALKLVFLKDKHMENTIKIDLLKDKQLMRKVNLSSFVFSIIALVVMVYCVHTSQVSYKAYFYCFVVYVLALPIHELIHGYFFKRYASDSVKIKYGFKSGFFYASNPGYIYKPNQFVNILMAPCVILNFVLLLLAILTSYKVVFLVATVLHLGSCMGDISMVLSILSTQKQYVVEGIRDTDSGIDILVGKKF